MHTITINISTATRVHWTETKILVSYELYTQADVRILMIYAKNGNKIVIHNLRNLIIL